MSSLWLYLRRHSCLKTILTVDGTDKLNPHVSSSSHIYFPPLGIELGGLVDTGYILMCEVHLPRCSCAEILSERVSKVFQYIPE
jgi:hypothetical protein